MRVTTIAGTGADRGHEHGREEAAAIADAAAALKTQLATAGHPPGPLGRRLAASGLVRAAADLTPDLWAEVTGLASGSRLGLEDILLLTFLDEVGALARPSGCSVVARTVPARPGIPPIPATTEIGQTMDLPDWTAGRMIVLRVGSDTAPTALVMSFPGSIGRCGANEAGLGVAVNALGDLTFSEDGLGVTFITRHLLTLSTLAEAEAFLTRVPHSAGQAYTVAAPDGIATWEAGTSGVHRVTAPDCPAVVHTDHVGGAGRIDDAVAPTLSSRERLALLQGGVDRGESLSTMLTGDLVLDGTRWDDHHVTLGAFRARGSEASARFIDGADVRAGRHEWSRLTYA